MPAASNFFIEYYETVANKITKEDYQKFKNASTDFDRIKILYPYCKDMPIPEPILGKNFEEAFKLKLEGNEFFYKGQINKAWKCYTRGIIKCPQSLEENAKELSVLIANRSACSFEKNEYIKSMLDIGYALSLRVYPTDKIYKLHLREAKCYDKIIGKRCLAAEAYKRARSSLDRALLKPEVLAAKKQEIDSALQRLNASPTVTCDIKVSGTPFISNDAFPNASEAIGFDKKESLGTFAYAKKDMECGTVIINEPAYCAVLAEEFTFTNCHNCMLATDTPIACAKCANVVFCSFDCMAMSVRWHGYECYIRSALSASGASINCHLALRLITQRTVDFFVNISEEKGKNKRFVTDHLCKTTHEYYGVYRLCCNEENRETKEYAQYTMMAIYLLLLLRKSKYFDQPSCVTSDEVIEIFIGSLILRNLQALQFNAHEISELREAPRGPLDPEDEPNFKAVYIGAGLYTMLARFNHACDPGIVRYNVGSNMVVRTIKPIKKGEMVYENYGPIYTNSPREDRQKFLSQRYWFNCNCKACEENWPQFKNMVEGEVKIPCSNKDCTNYFYLSKDSSFQLDCHNCTASTNLIVHLAALGMLEKILPQAEALYKARDYSKAADLYLNAMKIYSAHTIPPFPDWVKVQQRLRTCMVSEGNKSLVYKVLVNEDKKVEGEEKNVDTETIKIIVEEKKGEMKKVKSSKKKVKGEKKKVKGEK